MCVYICKKCQCIHGMYNNSHDGTNFLSYVHALVRICIYIFIYAYTYINVYTNISTTRMYGIIKRSSTTHITYMCTHTCIHTRTQTCLQRICMHLPNVGQRLKVAQFICVYLYAYIRTYMHITRMYALTNVCQRL